MFKYKRADRVGQLLKEEVSKILLFEIKDPELGFLTITKVKMSDDLRHAKIYFSVLGDKDVLVRTESVLARLCSHVRGEIGHRLNLRYVPEIKFYYDDTLAYAAHIEDIIAKIHLKSKDEDT
ncbi:30S ribosome-binding factor RbfA [candidate division KSB1 bacterium]|nr:30S ribosome-binding factor RbfA [candidate division KSB1 bacterium]